MLQPLVKIFPFLMLLCTGTTVSAQDDMISRGIQTFRETCLMADVRSEKIYQWAADRDLKIIKGQGPEHAGLKELTWEVARSGTASVLLQAYMNSPANLHCSVYFSEQRDFNKQVEAFFLEEVKRRHPLATRLNPGSAPDSTAYSFTDGKDLASGKNLYAYLDGRVNDQDKPHILLALFATLPPSDVAVPRTFATPERSYRFFVNACLTRFPNIENIGKYVVEDLGWKSQTAMQTTPFYHNIWSVWDPFDETGPYSFELIRSKAYKSCALHFDLRAAVPMDRLIRDYTLVHADAPTQGFPPGPSEKIEYYSGLAGGAPAIFKLRTEEKLGDGELSVSVETPQ